MLYFTAFIIRPSVFKAFKQFGFNVFPNLLFVVCSLFCCKLVFYVPYCYKAQQHKDNTTVFHVATRINKPFAVLS